MEVKIYLDRQLRTQSLILEDIKRIVYSNPKHIRGVEPYYDKKTLHSMIENVREKRELLTSRDFELLQTIVQKYSN